VERSKDPKGKSAKSTEESRAKKSMVKGRKCRAGGGFQKQIVSKNQVFFQKSVKKDRIFQGLL